MAEDRDVCLVATCHDPLGRFAPGIERVSDTLPDLFGAVAVNATSETDPATMTALRALDVPVLVTEHGAGTVGIGTARRNAVALGLRSDADRLFHSDLDHVLRWLDTSRDEVDACLRTRGHDMLVVGRSEAAMAQTPDRLRRTEDIVNDVYRLANGIDARWDLMIAMRLMTRDTARTIVEHSDDPTITNDVTWPMLVASHGRTVGSFVADGIRFLARDDFGQQVDDRDRDPREWHARMVTATAHIAAIVDSRPA